MMGLKPILLNIEVRKNNRKGKIGECIYLDAEVARGESHLNRQTSTFNLDQKSEERKRRGEIKRIKNLQLSTQKTLSMLIFEQSEGEREER